jgi:hypothetical protein
MLKIEIVPLRTEDDQRLFGMVLDMLIEIVLEMRGYSKGEIDERMGNIWIDRPWNCAPGAGALGGQEFWEAIGGEG